MPDELLAPCGLYCGACAVYQATQTNDEELKERLLDFYQGRMRHGQTLTLADIHCQGCLSSRRFAYCRHCPVRHCAQDRGLAGCHQCEMFPCLFIETFPSALGKKTILRAVPRWRQLPTPEWVGQELKRYQCPQCGRQLYRGASQCPACRQAVDLEQDGPGPGGA